MWRRKKILWASPAPFVFLAAMLASSASVTAQTTSELDAYWIELGRTVEAGDLEAYAALYHEDAVLVSSFSNNSYLISTALEEWEQGFIDTRAGRAKASVQFRFTQRLNDETTAHETGMFNYRFESTSGAVSDQYIHFEAMLVKKGEWKMVMEYQKSAGTVDDWNAIR